MTIRQREPYPTSNYSPPSWDQSELTTLSSVGLPEPERPRALREAPKPCLFVTHKDELRWFDEKVHKSIVFDEIRCTGETDGWSRRGKWPLVEQIKLLTADTPVSLHVRYGVARIPPKVVKLFTCTDTVLFTDDAQTRRRIHQLVNLYDHEGIWVG